MRVARWILLSALLALLACSRPDPTVILGTWRAETFAIDSLRLPIAPNFEVTRNDLILKAPDGSRLQTIPLAAIKADRDAIELELQGAFGIALNFSIESRDRIRFKVPLVGYEVIYNRI